LGRGPEELQRGYREGGCERSHEEASGRRQREGARREENLDHVDGVGLEVERRKDRMVLVDALLMYRKL
jgi:hypothetical protein